MRRTPHALATLAALVGGHACRRLGGTSLERTAIPGAAGAPSQSVFTRAGQGMAAAPGVRLLAIGDDALLAYTGFDGSNYTVESTQLAGGRPGAAQRLSPTGIDAVLGDAAADAKRGQIVMWRSGVAGADASRPPGASRHIRRCSPTCAAQTAARSVALRRSPLPPRSCPSHPRPPSIPSMAARSSHTPASSQRSYRSRRDRHRDLAQAPSGRAA
jgi:hypothetical protein